MASAVRSTRPLQKRVAPFPGLESRQRCQGDSPLLAFGPAFDCGEFRLKQYDRVEEDGTHMVIVPTIDEVARVGSHSSISDEKNNVHWLRATTETAFTFDVIVLDVQGKPYDIENIDPDGAETLSGGRLRVKKLAVEEALRKYGHDTHHG